MKKRKCDPFDGAFCDSQFDYFLALLHVRY